ncbi:hypothetical protein QBC41DRAFT_135237 [Cercophora samala]|uniref:Uncharacterized protein n=1 Tax=Cercophora samala TaxID=330535 RepID=A0AA40DDW5_9PEZI|nr:hypothetical protein QBC41DRAFT_135237 [Cercophora samala]
MASNAAPPRCTLFLSVLCSVNGCMYCTKLLWDGEAMPAEGKKRDLGRFMARRVDRELSTSCKPGPPGRRGAAEVQASSNTQRQRREEGSCKQLDRSTSPPLFSPKQRATGQRQILMLRAPMYCPQVARRRRCKNKDRRLDATVMEGGDDEGCAWGRCGGERRRWVLSWALPGSHEPLHGWSRVREFDDVPDAQARSDREAQVELFHVMGEMR